MAWEHTSDPSVRAYRVYFASATFPDVESATLAAEVQASNSSASPLRPSRTDQFDRVVHRGHTGDDVFERTSVEPVFLAL